MADRLRKKRDSIRGSTTKILSKVDNELSKEAANLDLLEEFMEQLLLKEEWLDTVDGEIEEQMKMK